MKKKRNISYKKEICNGLIKDNDDDVRKKGQKIGRVGCEVKKKKKGHR